jgi:hypothetical protein
MWVSDGIFHIVAKQGSVHGRAEAEENFAAIPSHEQMTGRPTLADLRHVRSIDREARAVYRDEQNNNASAVAILVESPLSRAIGNFFLGLSKLEMPARLFTSESKAFEWLRSFLQRRAARAHLP